MKLDHANPRSASPLLQKGDTYKAAGRNYRIVRVSGSTVTAEAMPTFLESVGRFFRSLAAPYRWAMRRRVAIAEVNETPATGEAMRLNRRAHPRRLSREQRKRLNRALSKS